jgi:hypothetical protein
LQRLRGFSQPSHQNRYLIGTDSSGRIHLPHLIDPGVFADS